MTQRPWVALESRCDNGVKEGPLTTRVAVEVATPGYLTTDALGRPSSPIAAWALFGMGASGGSQASRRVEAQMASAPELRRVLEEVAKGWRLSQVQT